MDSNFFNKNASKIESTFQNKKNATFNNTGSLNEERFDRISQNISNYDGNSSMGQNNDIVMKKIVLQEPQTKLNKDDRSVRSINSGSVCKLIFFYLINSCEN